MKVTKEQLVEIISEEIQQALSESLLKEDYVYNKIQAIVQQNVTKALEIAQQTHQGILQQET